MPLPSVFSCWSRTQTQPKESRIQWCTSSVVAIKFTSFLGTWWGQSSLYVWLMTCPSLKLEPNLTLPPALPPVIPVTTGNPKSRKLKPPRLMSHHQNVCSIPSTNKSELCMPNRARYSPKKNRFRFRRHVLQTPRGFWSTGEHLNRCLWSSSSASAWQRWWRRWKSWEPYPRLQREPLEGFVSSHTFLIIYPSSIKFVCRDWVGKFCFHRVGGAIIDAWSKVIGDCDHNSSIDPTATTACKHPATAGSEE